jgi:hypothetical protein
MKLVSWNDPVLYEVFVLWPAWQTIVEPHLMPDEHATTVDPIVIYDRFVAVDDPQKIGRLAALLYARSNADTIGEGFLLLTELLVMARAGRRPPLASEAGLVLPETPEERLDRLAAGKTRAMVAKERRDTSWVQEEHDHGA